jgi:DNA-binding transcriptional MerR regulator
MKNLLDTLKTLDPTDDSLWTDDGLPALDAVKAVTGLDKVTRANINKVALGLTRSNVVDYVAPESADKEEEIVETQVVEVNQDILGNEIDVLRNELAQLNDAKKALEEQIAAKANQLNEAERKIVRPLDSELNAQVIADYIASAQRERDMKTEQIKKLESSGMSMKEIKELLGMNKRKR